MDTKTETVRAITDEMRRAAWAETDLARLYGWADRIDLALASREAEVARETNEAAERAFERGRASTHGNVAELRKALENAIAVLRDDLPTPRDISRAFEAANAALAEPPRNCDRFKTANDAVAAYVAEHPYEDEPDASTYGSWLFATAKGGAE